MYGEIDDSSSSSVPDSQCSKIAPKMYISGITALQFILEYYFIFILCILSTEVILLSSQQRWILRQCLKLDSNKTD